MSRRSCSFTTQPPHFCSKLLDLLVHRLQKDRHLPTPLERVVQHRDSEGAEIADRHRVSRGIRKFSLSREEPVRSLSQEPQVRPRELDKPHVTIHIFAVHIGTLRASRTGGTP